MKIISNIKFQISNKYQYLKKKQLEIGLPTGGWLLEIPRQSGAGFSLIELIIYMGLLSVMLTVLVDIFVSSISVQLESEATSSVVQDSQYIVGKLSYDIRQASNIVVPAGIGTQTNTLQLVSNSNTYTYSVVNNTLYVTSSLGTYALSGYGTTINNFLVTRVGNATGKQSVQVVFTVTSKTQRREKPETRTIQTVIGTR